MAAAIQDQSRQTALQYGVDPAIALAVAQRESSFNQGARGAAGEVGVFQLMPATARGLNVDPYDQTANINGGISLLAQLYNQFGDWATALAHYNGGNNPPSQSYDYASKVLSTATVYGAPAPGAIQAPDVQEASLLPDVASVPVWAWWTLGSVVVAALVLKRD